MKHGAKSYSKKAAAFSKAMNERFHAWLTHGAKPEPCGGVNITITVTVTITTTVLITITKTILITLVVALLLLILGLCRLLLATTVDLRYCRNITLRFRLRLRLHLLLQQARNSCINFRVAPWGAMQLQTLSKAALYYLIGWAMLSY